jgi:hypothetical protein
MAIDFGTYITEIFVMVEKDTHIVSRFAGIPMAGCRGVDHAI